MPIIYKPDPSQAPHGHTPPRNQPSGTIWRCEYCGEHWVAASGSRWYRPFPLGPAWRRIRRIQRGETP